MIAACIVEAVPISVGENSFACSVKLKLVIVAVLSL